MRIHALADRIVMAPIVALTIFFITYPPLYGLGHLFGIIPKYDIKIAELMWKSCLALGGLWGLLMFFAPDKEDGIGMRWRTQGFGSIGATFYALGFIIFICYFCVTILSIFTSLINNLVAPIDPLQLFKKNGMFWLYYAIIVWSYAFALKHWLRNCAQLRAEGFKDGANLFTALILNLIVFMAGARIARGGISEVSRDVGVDVFLLCLFTMIVMTTSAHIMNKIARRQEAAGV